MYIHTYIHICRVGIELPTIEVRYEQLTVEADVVAAGRALPTLSNAATNFIQVRFLLLRSFINVQLVVEYACI